MKKKIFIGSVIAAAAISIAGCAGGGGENETATTTVSETTKETETTTSATTAIETASSTVEKNTEETNNENETTTTADSESATEADSGNTSSGGYLLSVKKIADGFEKVDDMTCSSATAEYTYTILNDVTNHTIESVLDDEAASFKDSTTGRSGDVLYAKGKTQGGYCMTAYRYVGTGDTVSAFAGIQYLSEEEIAPEVVEELLSDDYISVTK